MTNLYAVENIDIDLNSLFNLTYNFDLLKKTLEAILTNQKNNSQHIKDLQEKLEEKDKKIEEIEDKLKKKDDYDGKLSKQLLDLENKVNDQVLLDLTEIKKKLTGHDEKLNIHSILIEELKKGYENIGSRIDDMTKIIDQLNIKIMDFNIFDAMKQKNTEGEENLNGQDFNKLLGLIENMKITYSKKFDKIDDDSKNLKTDINNVRNQLDFNIKQTSTHKEQIESIFVKIEQLKNNCNNHSEICDKSMKEQISKLQDFINTKLKEIINSNNNSDNKGPIMTTPLLNDQDLKMLKDDNKRINELEKLLKDLSLKIENNDQIKKIFSLLDKKANLDDLKDAKSELTNIINEKFMFYKETIDQIMNDMKELTEITVIKRKIDNIMQQLGNIRNINDDHETKTVKNPLPVEGKYVEITIFNEFTKNHKLQIENINIRIDELKKLIDEILSELKKKVSEKDLKNLEEFLLSNFEELRIACNKKFADKNETAKNIKYLDAQIKQLELLIKKSDKGDNWLLAKKPIDGFACASCETYIGDLHDNNQYIPWNKYPMRDPNEKLYRVGNGFSRMLQMLNLDNATSGKVKEIQYQTSSNFFQNKEKDNILKESHNMNTDDVIQGKKENIFSKTKNNFHSKIESNMSLENVDGEEKYDDPYGPKIMKIYKKTKKE